MHPGGFGVAEEDCNCRCGVLPVIEGMKALTGETRKAAWKSYDGNRHKHEAALEARVRSGFAEIERRAVAALRGQA